MTTKTEDAVNNIFVPKMSDNELADMYGETPVDKLISMIVENIAGGFKFTQEELRTILSKCLPTTLLDLMCLIHRFNETRQVGVTYTTGTFLIPTPKCTSEMPKVKPPAVIIKYLPYQACPICNGTGIMNPKPWDSIMFPTCDVCHGAKIILMFPIPEKE